MDNNTRRIRRITLWGAAVNIVLIISKLCAGVFGRSQALIADAIHSISDLATDLAVLIGMRYWAEGPDADHPYGHAKLEMLITAVIGGALALVALEIVKSAGVSLWAIVVRHETPDAPNVWALYAALVSIVLKEALFRVTKKTGEETHSPAVVANAYHHRSDALSSIPPAVAVGLSLWFGEKCAFLDPAGALAVALMLFYAAWKIANPAISILMDRGMSQENMEFLHRLGSSVPGVLEVHKMRSRPTGYGDFVIDLHILLEPETTVKAGHDIASRVTAKIHESRLPVREVIVHIEPRD